MGGGGGGGDPQSWQVQKGAPSDSTASPGCARLPAAQRGASRGTWERSTGGAGGAFRAEPLCPRAPRRHPALGVY